ncbi:Hypothetical Protein FCC1311_112192 [Hondaea fermentalgiana]|uniref:Uncharacterized protein n=1 Tax=Hondaea fermentalgiana TaxID=2315210 RepID=A0A2R5GVZ0_9STRA|nr:Hypothetical Protein FCC1311_112192 [Hondaea fermentalgiana]|eukprot:GBG34997.1 Hypothetical Protein FCC1311_112192 [Hondaea fermentalgiana]
MASSHAELEEKIRRAMSFEDDDDDDDDDEEEEEEEEEDYEDDYEPEENGTAGKDAQNVAHESSINFTAQTSSLAAQILRSGLGSPAHGALQRAVRELRIVKAERDALREALKAANPQSVVDKTKAQMDREFRLVIKAMMDEKARALRAANAKTDFLREQLALEKNRAGMALAELEGMRTQRRADVPRRHETSQARTVPMQVRSGAGPRVRFRRPDMLAPRAPTVSGRFVFASDEEEDEDGKSSNNEVITAPKVSPLRSRQPAPAPSRQPVLADSRRSPRQKPPRIKSREGSRVDMRQETRQNVQVGRVRAFLKQSELLPPSMQAADLGVLLVKHSRRSSVVTLEQFQDLLADLALGLIRCGIVTVDENETTQETVGEPWEWGVREPRIKVSKASALRALGQVLFPPEADKKES